MRSPPPLLLAAALALALAPDPALGQDQDEGFVCDIPTAGCTNGMFNQALCICECISPFCPDSNGDCTNPSDNCGGNKWKDCTRGVNCPWWVNPLKAESCFTGPEVPLGLWQVYNTRAACCNSNFPYSEYCDAKPESTGPTRHPTIIPPEDDIYEVIPIKFDVSGLPNDIKMRDLKDQMKTVLKRILLRLSDRIPGLRISSVEEKVVINRALARRGLQKGKDVSLYFNVYVIRDDSKKFGRLIISEIRDSYDEVLDQIQTFADTKYFGADLNLNWCTSQNGKFELCVKEIIEKPPPEPAAPPARRPTIAVRPPTSLTIESRDPPVEKKGLPGWAITLIIIIVLLLLCCIAYAVFTMCLKRDNDSNEVQNNIYMDDKYNRDRSRGADNDVYFVDEKSHASRSRRSRRNRGSRRPRIAEVAYEEEEEDDNKDEVQIVLAEPQNPRFDDDSFSINTYGTKTPKRPARDPTMYIPGQENRPDPETYLIENGERNYYQEDPPLKPKRDPTMYVEGQADPSMYTESRRDPSMYHEGDYGNEGDPPLKPKRDPTMYVDGQASEFGDVDGASRNDEYGASQAEEYGAERGGEEEYNSDLYGMGRNEMSGRYDEEGEEYDDYGFQESELEGEYMTSDTNAEYSRGRKDPSYYTETTSYRTKSPKSSSKRSKKSKKKSRSSR